jgi:hypothetical protein
MITGREQGSLLILCGRQAILRALAARDRRCQNVTPLDPTAESIEVVFDNTRERWRVLRGYGERILLFFPNRRGAEAIVLDLADGRTYLDALPVTVTRLNIRGAQMALMAPGRIADYIASDIEARRFAA